MNTLISAAVAAPANSSMPATTSNRRMGVLPELFTIRYSRWPLCTMGVNLCYADFNGQKIGEERMTTRRNLLKGAGAFAGLVFCGCGLPWEAHAQTAARARQPVTVRGKRIKTIDVHSHCFFQQAIDAAGEKLEP